MTTVCGGSVCVEFSSTATETSATTAIAVNITPSRRITNYNNQKKNNQNDVPTSTTTPVAKSASVLV